MKTTKTVRINTGHRIVECIVHRRFAEVWVKPLRDVGAAAQPMSSADRNIVWVGRTMWYRVNDTWLANRGGDAAKTVLGD